MAKLSTQGIPQQTPRSPINRSVTKEKSNSTSPDVTAVLMSDASLTRPIKDTDMKIQCKDVNAEVEALVSQTPKKKEQHQKADHIKDQQSLKTATETPKWDPTFIGRPMMIDGVMVEDYVASQDLNECVDALLKKGIKHS